MDMLNRPVKHVKFGAGVIKECANGTMQVYFEQYGARFFHYPEAFDRFLTTDDEALKIQVSADLDVWRAARAEADARFNAKVEAEIQAARPVKKPAVKRTATVRKTTAKK